MTRWRTKAVFQVAPFVFMTMIGATASAQQTAAVDGDTIRVEGKIYRLWGIDAPEIFQTCADDWQAGQQALEYLGRLLDGHTVSCEPRTQDQYGQTIAVCRADGRDLSAEMVRAGMAWAYVQYSNDYVDEEKQAASARAGVHAHACLTPWDWRAQKR